MKTVGKVLLYLALFLLVPFLLGRVAAGILQAVDPASAYPDLITQLEHVRAQTRLTLLLVVGYYVVLVAALTGLWLRRRRSRPS